MLIKFCCLFRLDLQTQSFFKGLMFQHQRRTEPEIVGFTQVLQDAGSDGNGGHALRHGFHKAVEGAGLAVALHLVAAAAQEGADFTR